MRRQREEGDKRHHRPFRPPRSHSPLFHQAKTHQIDGTSLFTRLWVIAFHLACPCEGRLEHILRLLEESLPDRSAVLAVRSEFDRVDDLASVWRRACVDLRDFVKSVQHRRASRRYRGGRRRDRAPAFNVRPSALLMEQKILRRRMSMTKS